MPSCPTRVASLVLVAFAIASSSRARAFNYPEHAWLTERGLAVLLDAHPRARDLLESIRRVVNSDRLCPAQDLMVLGEPSCLSLADFPALAADHSSSPPALLARWFAVIPKGQVAALVAGLERVNDALLVNVGAAITNADPGNDEPHECGEPTAPDGVPAFIRAVRRYRVVHGKRVPTDDLDTDLAAIDADYLCLALNGSHHFRVPGMSIEDAAYATTPNALGAYANYHLAALAFARLASQSTEARARWAGLAVLTEMFALHFIEDAVAAGHNVVDYGTLNPASIKATHDAFNRDGLRVRIPDAACRAIAGRTSTFPRLVRVCDGGVDDRADWVWRTARVRGDGAISLATEHPDPDDVTVELTTLLVAESLAEVVAVADGTVDPELGACVAGLAPCIDPAPGRSLEMSCTLAWFETHACAPRSTAMAAFQADLLRPLRMLPTSAQRVFPTYIFSGHAFTLLSSYRIASLASFGRIVGIGERAALTAESQNALGVGWTYTTPPTPSGAFALGAALHLPVLRIAEVFGAGFGLGLRLDWLPADEFFLVGLGAASEVTDLFTSDEKWSSFFYGALGTEIVNNDTISFRMTADIGWHIGWGETSSFAAGVALRAAFKVGGGPE